MCSPLAYPTTTTTTPQTLTTSNLTIERTKTRGLKVLQTLTDEGRTCVSPFRWHAFIFFPLSLSPHAHTSPADAQPATVREVRPRVCAHLILRNPEIADRVTARRLNHAQPAVSADRKGPTQRRLVCLDRLVIGLLLCLLPHTTTLTGITDGVSKKVRVRTVRGGEVGAGFMNEG